MDLSIILPVYNVGAFLPACLDSIICQSFSNFEIIAINDGSKDNSLEILMEYSKKDSRIKYFNKNNGGVSSARNLGISKAVGDWIMFLDPDDILLPGALARFQKVASNSIDMVFANFQHIDNTGRLSHSSTYSNQQLISKEKALELFFEIKKNFQGYLWNRIFRMDYVKNINLKFDEQIHYKEDGLFLVQYVVRCANRILFIPYEVYKYYDRPDSAMMNVAIGFSDKYYTNLLARIKIYHEVKTLNDKELIFLAKKSISDISRNIIQKIITSHYGYSYIFKTIKQLIDINLFHFFILQLVKSIAKKIIK